MKTYDCDVKRGRTILPGDAPAPDQRWASVEDAGPALIQRWVGVFSEPGSVL